MTGKDESKQPSRSLHEEPRDFAQDSKVRFAPADNLYDAIRSDIAPLGEFEFIPLARDRKRGIPFFDPDYEDECSSSTPMSSRKRCNRGPPKP